MTSDQFSGLARKEPALGVARYPTAAEVAVVLRGKKQADGSYLCRCPCWLHRRGDINPSLSVRDGRRGRPIFNCFAGGDYREIVGALIARGVWPRR